VMVGAVGEDSQGDALLDSLASYGVNVAEVARNAASHEVAATGSAVVMVDQQTRQNRIHPLCWSERLSTSRASL
jgi:sugar/nucleoside kinase (ribokinase family)